MKNVVSGPAVDVQPPMKVASEGYAPSNPYPSNMPIETYIEVNGIKGIDPLKG